MLHHAAAAEGDGRSTFVAAGLHFTASWTKLTDLFYSQDSLNPPGFYLLKGIMTQFYCFLLKSYESRKHKTWFNSPLKKQNCIFFTFVHLRNIWNWLIIDRNHFGVIYAHGWFLHWVIFKSTWRELWWKVTSGSNQRLNCSVNFRLRRSCFLSRSVSDSTRLITTFSVRRHCQGVVLRRMDS